MTARVPFRLAKEFAQPSSSTSADVSQQFWEQLTDSRRPTSLNKLAWRIMRQYVQPQTLLTEFMDDIPWLWQVDNHIADGCGTSLRLLLKNAAAQRAEVVVLFPNGKLSSKKLGLSKTQRATACVSSQPGCGVGCPFCSTAKLGYRGNLTAFEIIEQVYWAGVCAAKAQRRLRNVVFMGMGEPLHNQESVLHALDILTSPNGFGLSPRHITVSTAGVPSGMILLAETFPAVRQALSLHAVDRQLRRRLVPRAVSDLMLLHRTLERVNDLQIGQPVWLEFVLLNGVNDTLQHAHQLLEFCHGLNVEVNLIPYNVAGNRAQFSPSTQANREAFAELLRASGVRTTFRTSLGSDVNAACGQLTAQVGMDESSL
ncbi:MAG: radical SAM protein [Planctomycetales bacterium]|nr:radical SAM protein [Planctomycetales bacterium]